MKIRKNDTVTIIAGKDKGKTGKVIRVLPKQNAVVVEQINQKKKHQRPTQKSPTGGIVDIEAPIHISNVMLVDAKTGKGSRVKTKKGRDGSKTRVAVKSGTAIG